MEEEDDIGRAGTVYRTCVFSFLLLELRWIGGFDTKSTEMSIDGQ
jgi:hypothetical protein